LLTKKSKNYSSIFYAKISKIERRNKTMAFKLDDLIIDRIQYGVAEDFDGNLLYTLTQLADATIDITAESKDAVDATGTLIKRFYQGKAGEFTANNAMLNLNILGAASGEGKMVAGAGEAAIDMPKIVTVKAGETVTLANFVEGSITVNALSTNGSMGKAYTQSTAPSTSTFGFAADTGVLTPPTDAAETQYIVKYTRKVESGVAIKNKAGRVIAIRTRAQGT
jgi:plastocyanin